MLDTTMNRRGFVKLAAATVAMAAASEGLITQPALAETATPAAGDVKRIRSCCRACGKMECGVWVTVEDGKAVRVEGDNSAPQSRGNCCTKSQSSVQAGLSSRPFALSHEAHESQGRRPWLGAHLLG